jgi:hypothetical protein
MPSFPLGVPRLPWRPGGAAGALGAGAHAIGDRSRCLCGHGSLANHDRCPASEDAAVGHLPGRPLFQNGRHREAERRGERCSDGGYQKHAFSTTPSGVSPPRSAVRRVHERAIASAGQGRPVSMQAPFSDRSAPFQEDIECKPSWLGHVPGPPGQDAGARAQRSSWLRSTTWLAGGRGGMVTAFHCVTSTRSGPFVTRGRRIQPRLRGRCGTGGRWLAGTGRGRLAG